VIEGAARYLGEGEAIIACVIDERASLGYELAVKGLLGRRRPLIPVWQPSPRQRPNGYWRTHGPC
jgi:hypothetical protein